ncbi:hypothetical protein BN3456_00003 [Clostridium sp. C105KSO13]|nr:hypothetical protein BN3456_00003 [Clostridium sp. C105KSO13]
MYSLQNVSYTHLTLPTICSVSGFVVAVVTKKRINAGETFEYTIGEGENAVAYSFVSTDLVLSLIHISEPTRQAEISYAVFCLKKKKSGKFRWNSR